MPSNTYTNYEGVKVQNHVLEVFRRNAARETHMTTQRRAESMLDTLWNLPYGSKLEGWGYGNCRHASRVLSRWIRVFGG